MITIRRARLADAPLIAVVHVAAWRSTYPAILPNAYLARLSVRRQAVHYEATIRNGFGVHVASASGADAEPAGGPARVVGCVTCAPAQPGTHRQAEGEIETLYVLDDWRERGLGRRLMRAAAAHLIAAGCRSAFLWVLRDNPSRWFYERLGGRVGAEATVRVAGAPVVQIAYVWPDIATLEQAVSPAR